MVRAYEVNQPISIGQPRGKEIIVSGAVILLVAHPQDGALLEESC